MHKHLKIAMQFTTLKLLGVYAKKLQGYHNFFINIGYNGKIKRI